MKKFLIFAFLLLLSVGFLQAQDLSIEVSSKDVSMNIGQTMQLGAAVVDASGKKVADREFIFYSTNSRALTVVDSTGMATAVKHGEYDVIVISPGDPQLRSNIKVTVAPAAISKVEIAPLPEHVYAGVTVPLEIKVTDKAGFERPEKVVKLTSSDERKVGIAPFDKLIAKEKGKVMITASVDGVEQKLEVDVLENPIAEIHLKSDMVEGRSGDVFTLTAVALDKHGNEIADAPINFSFTGESFDVSAAPSGLITQEGKFVADEPGLYVLNATCGPAAASVTIQANNRNITRQIDLIGQGSVNDKHTSDLWVWEGVDGRDYAVTGTWGSDGSAYFWDVTDPAGIELIDSVKVDARTVNDVKVSEDGKVAVISREGASNRKNGLVIVDVSNPRDAKIISEFSENLTGGVHNVFIYQNHVYALSAGRKYYSINIEDPANPKIVGEFELDTPGHAIHDVWVEDGIAYSSNWSDGVQLVDVGNGIAGGTPANPVQFASYAYPSGSNHAAFPYRDKKTGKFYVILGDEEFPYGLDPDGRKPGRAAGFLHVIDFTDLKNPKEVAWFKVPLAGSHNFWIEDDILYAAFYNGGVRVVDISGELLGDLNRQGREIAWIVPADPDGYVSNAPFTWGAQPHKGHIFYSDWNSGLWSAKLQPVIPENSKIEEAK
ncbi:Ig-like domain-containing protein [Algoriphagus chordae]|uniref:Ig-like protein group 2 n=1 Tax=Algoriphagus chordae TaxID=237019 RepID=A0A2W7QFF5_9BACT|nr:Ig-like domain-containing protein [Algoriphagus chordae]PZX46983.1 Ig-like protein group 2 [Algoriphagus chordae]